PSSNKSAKNKRPLSRNSSTRRKPRSAAQSDAPSPVQRSHHPNPTVAIQILGAGVHPLRRQRPPARRPRGQARLLHRRRRVRVESGSLQRGVVSSRARLGREVQHHVHRSWVHPLLRPLLRLRPAHRQEVGAHARQPRRLPLRQVRLHPRLPLQQKSQLHRLHLLKTPTGSQLCRRCPSGGLVEVEEVGSGRRGGR
ncbi:hypothetical protein FRC07_005399, partial [Ceratobasidium sp. 392]